MESLAWPAAMRAACKLATERLNGIIKNRKKTVNFQNN
jgi:hypothetical protein